jgi:3-dehydroquinate synthase
VNNIKVRIPASQNRSYEIALGTTLKKVSEDIAFLFPNSSCFILTDSNVYFLYAKPLKKLLIEQGIKTATVYFEAGEKYKTRKTKEKLEDKILKFGVKRNSIIIALGGGVVGDIAGFVAATIHRGIPLIQIPTTLLAQVDSSIGGKVSVDHTLGKNLIGTFYQPKKVYIDISTLNTLSRSEFSNGLSEIVKYGLIFDKWFFSFLVNNWVKINNRDTKTILYIIERCNKLKADVVRKDELESGMRKILNFGHTFAHAIESLSNYKIQHGPAVAIGMILETQLAHNIGILQEDITQQIGALLLLLGLPIRIPINLKLSDIISATRYDKKGSGAKINYTLIDRIGHGVINVAISEREVRRAFGLK